MVKIIVDSTCDMPDEFVKKHNIPFLPLRVFLNGKEFLDKVNIQIDEVYEAMRNGIVPMTSQPRPDDINSLFEEYCKNGQDFIYIAFSSKMSCTYQLSLSVIEELGNKYPGVKMEIIDSKGGSTATGLIAMQAVMMTEAGESFERISSQIKELSNHVEHIFTITDLNWLIKGGRVSRVEGFIGSILDIKPVLDVKDGLIEIVKKVRGRKKALNTVVDMIVERIKDFPEQYWV